MMENKKIKIMTLIGMIVSVFASIFFIVEGGNNQSQASMNNEVAYESEIFGTEIISIEIIADDDDWEEMLENAVSEEYIMADVVVNGTTFTNVGVRPKGNSSLTEVANSDSDRYSFRIQFDEYIDGQTAFGLESLVVNNMVGDNTYMKEYISYDLMSEMGVDSPLFGYTDMTINGEDWGLYLAIELYNDSYEERVFNDLSGELYNVKNISKEVTGDGAGMVPSIEGGPPMELEDRVEVEGEEPTENSLGGGQRNRPPQNIEDNSIDETFAQNSVKEEAGVGETSPPNAGEGAQGNRSMQQTEEVSSGGSLQYTDDNSDSYPEIFENVVGTATESDFQSVIEALEALSKGEELENYFDVEQILKYLAVHTIVVNLDSYSSSMAQNYYLYENDGQVTILPWDYNLAWGGFQSSDATTVINFPIDTPVSDVDMSTRPLLEKLFENTEYLDMYHEYLNEILETYFLDGQFEQKVNEVYDLISGYVKNDPTAFIEYDEYEEAVASFIELGTLRAQSVEGQLDGTIPSTTDGQTSNPEALVNAGNLNISTLGSMGGGNRGGEDAGNERGPQQGQTEGVLSEKDPEVMMRAMDLIFEADGEPTDEILEELLSLGFTEEQIEELTTVAEENVNKEAPGNAGNTSQENVQEKNQMVPGVGTDSSENISINDSKGYMEIGIFSVGILGALFFAKNYKRNY